MDLKEGENAFCILKYIYTVIRFSFLFFQEFDLAA